MTPKSNLHFARFEFKYLLDPALRQAVEKELTYFVDFDPFVKESPGHRYSVRSLYFDDPALSAFYNKIDGQHSRAKFRLRTYSESMGSLTPIFLEIKMKNNNLVSKHRVQLENDGAKACERGENLTKWVLESPIGNPVRDEFEFQVHRRRLTTSVLVDYYRRAYLSKYDPEFRLTFDDELRATPSDSLFPGGMGPGLEFGKRSLLAGRTIMEIKFRFHIPSWFHRIIQAYQLERVSISKACIGMDRLGLAANLS